MYITKSEMIEKFGKNYFGLTEFSVKPMIYIRNDLPECVQVSVIAHEQEHVKNGVNSPEWKSWIAGFKASPVGWALSVIMSLTPSRLKMYPALTSGITLFTTIILFIYLGE